MKIKRYLKNKKMGVSVGKVEGECRRQCPPEREGEGGVCWFRKTDSTNWHLFPGSIPTDPHPHYQIFEIKK